MDLLDLIDRQPLDADPISLIIRNLNQQSPEAVVQKAVEILRHRAMPDEIVLVTKQTRSLHLPARIHGIRIRTIAPCSPTEPSELAAAIAVATKPILLLLDARLAIEPDELEDLLQRLDFADLVVARRRRNIYARALNWPLERLVRAIFAVPLADPLAPVKAIRRAAVHDLVLQLPEPTADFELIAKMTYLVSLIDEIPIADPWTGPGLLKLLVRQSPKQWAIWWHPTLWRSSTSARPANRVLKRPLDESYLEPEEHHSAPTHRLAMPRPRVASRILPGSTSPLAPRPAHRFPNR